MADSRNHLQRNPGKMHSWTFFKALGRFGVILAGVVFISPLYAESPVCQKLDSRNSRLAFEVSWGFMHAHGYFQEVQGELSLNPADFSSAVVHLRVDPASARFQADQQSGTLLEPLLRSLAVGPVHMRARVVSPAGYRRFQARGEITGGVSKQAISFLVEAVQVSSGRTRVKSVLAGEGPALPSLSGAVSSQGTVSADLTFVAVAGGRQRCEE